MGNHGQLGEDEALFGAGVSLQITLFALGALFPKCSPCKEYILQSHHKSAVLACPKETKPFTDQRKWKALSSVFRIFTLIQLPSDFNN